MNKLLRFVEEDGCPFWLERWVFRVVRFYSNIKNGVRNIVRWLPVIWRDRNYDYSFVMLLLEAKIKFMRNEFLRMKYYKDYDKDVENMNEALKYLDIIIRPEYYGRNSDIQQDNIRRELFKLLEEELPRWWW